MKRSVNYESNTLKILNRYLFIDIYLKLYFALIYIDFHNVYLIPETMKLVLIVLLIAKSSLDYLV